MRNHSARPLGKVIGYIRAEPVACQGVVQASLALLVGFDVLNWSNEQAGLTMALTAAILTLIARRHVTPTASAATVPSGPDRTRQPATKHAGD